jgi:hypothetical protein
MAAFISSDARGTRLSNVLAEQLLHAAGALMAKPKPRWP